MIAINVDIAKQIIYSIAKIISLQFEILVSIISISQNIKFNVKILIR